MKMEGIIWIFLLFIAPVNYGIEHLALQEGLGKSLINNVKDGKIDAVKKLLVSGVNPNFQDKDGKTALMYAAEKGYIDTVKLLLDYGALIFLKDNDGETAENKVIKKIPADISSLYDLDSELFGPIPWGAASIVSRYADIRWPNIYRQILDLLKDTAQNRSQKRKEKVKGILYARDFGVPVASLQDIINEYVEENEEVANSEENYSPEVKRMEEK